jgi:predicted anti-sigma-YlaC factor YlaD
MSRLRFNDCERARVLASLAPDGELSQLERRVLRTHLRSCAPCARYAFGVEHVSALVRAEEYERPAFPTLVPHIVRRRQLLAARARPVAAAAAVALMALGIASRAPLDMDAREEQARTTTGFASQQLELNSLRELPRNVNVRPLDRSATVGRNQPV